MEYSTSLYPNYLLFQDQIFNCIYVILLVYTFSSGHLNCFSLNEFEFLMFLVAAVFFFFFLAHIEQEIHASNCSLHRLPYLAALGNDWRLASWARALALCRSSVVLTSRSDDNVVLIILTTFWPDSGCHFLLLVHHSLLTNASYASILMIQSVFDNNSSIPRLLVILKVTRKSWLSWKASCGPCSFFTAYTRLPHCHSLPMLLITGFTFLFARRWYQIPWNQSDRQLWAYHYGC